MGLTSNLGKLSSIITSTGSAVGIGTSSPSYTLDVTGTGRFTGTITAGAANGNIRLSGTTDAFIGVNTSTMYLTDWATAAKGMVINLSTGNVGIGTSSPLTLLHLASSGNTFLTIDAASASNSGLAFYKSGAAAGAIYYLGGSDAMRFDTNNSERMRITTAGNVGIGTSSPSTDALLHLAQNTLNLNLYLQNTNGSGKTWSLNSDNAGKFNIHDTTANRFTITSTGNVGIGTSSPNSISGYTIVDIQNVTNGGLIQLGTNGTGYGQLYNNTAEVQLRTITSIPLTFGTNSTERMRITTAGSGTVIVGGTTAAYSSTNRGNLTLSGTSSSLLGFHNGTSATGYIYNDYSANLFQWVSASNTIQVVVSSLGVQLSANATSWSSLSDERLKNINSNIDNAVEKLMTLRTINFSWKSDKNNKENLGLIAQDVEKVFPQVIDKNKLSNVIDKQLDETEYLGVRYTELVPVLVKAIQELEARLKTLENK